MTPTVQTLRGAWRRKTNVQALPEHPVERTEAFKGYLNHVGAPDAARPALQLILRTMAPCGLSQLTTIHVDHAVDKLLADGYKSTSVDRYRKILVAFLNWAQVRGYVQKNVAAMAKKPDMRQVKKFSPKSVPDNIRDTLDRHYQDPAKATVEEMFMWAGFKSGMRISELAMAVTGDIEMKPIPGGGFKPYIWMGTKTEKRLVDFPQWVTPALLAILEAAQGDREHPLVYLNGIKVVWGIKGTIRVRALKLRELFYKVQRELFGKPVANPHAFRSDYITRALKRHPDFLTLEAVAKRCGHDPEILREYYADLLGAGPADLAEI